MPAMGYSFKEEVMIRVAISYDFS